MTVGIFISTTVCRENKGKIASVSVRIDERINHFSSSYEQSICIKNQQPVLWIYTAQMWNNPGESEGAVWVSEYSCCGLTLISGLLDGSGLTEFSVISFT